MHIEGVTEVGEAGVGAVDEGVGIEIGVGEVLCRVLLCTDPVAEEVARVFYQLRGKGDGHAEKGCYVTTVVGYMRGEVAVAAVDIGKGAVAGVASHGTEKFVYHILNSLGISARETVDIPEEGGKCSAPALVDEVFPPVKGVGPVFVHGGVHCIVGAEQQLTELDCLSTVGAGGRKIGEGNVGAFQGHEIYQVMAGAEGVFVEVVAGDVAAKCTATVEVGVEFRAQAADVIVMFAVESDDMLFDTEYLRAGNVKVDINGIVD